VLPRFCTVCQRSSHVKVGVRAGAPTSRIQDHHWLPPVAQACRWPLLLSASACNTARSSKAPGIVQLRAPAAVRRQTDSGACYGARTAGLRGGPTPRAPSKHGAGEKTAEKSPTQRHSLSQRLRTEVSTRAVYVCITTTRNEAPTYRNTEQTNARHLPTVRTEQTSHGSGHQRSTLDPLAQLCVQPHCHRLHPISKI